MIDSSILESKALYGALLFCATIFLNACVKAEKPQPSVVKVIDGDTLLLEFPQKKTDELNEPVRKKVSLMFIDAPEREQPGGREAKAALKGLMDKGNISWQFNADKTKAVLVKEDKELNLFLVEQGLVWVSPQMADAEKAKQYRDAEHDAKKQLLGLWSLGHGKMVAPWEWRKQATEQVMPQYSQQMQRLQQYQQQQRHQQIMLQQRQASQQRQMALQQKQRKKQQGENQ